MILSLVILLTACSSLLCLLLTLPVQHLALQLGWVDQPDLQRKIHRVPVPRIGGIPVVLACAGSFGALLAMGLGANPAVEQSLSVAWKLLPASALAFLTGLLDDLVGLRPTRKLGGQVLAASLACLGGFHFRIFADLGWGPAWDLALTLAWLVLCANAFNLIDGVDGLATGTGLIATLTMLLVALLRGNMGLVVTVAPLAGSLLGFLLFNFNPASIFLGDCGSLSIGFILGCFAVMLSQSSATLPTMIAPAVALSIPLLDTTLSLARRYVGGRPIFTADHDHVHHRLIERGFTPRRVCLILFAASVLASYFSLVLTVSPDFVGVFTVIVFGATASMAIRYLHYKEFGVFANLLRNVRFNVQSRLSLQDYEGQLQKADSPEACWSVVRKAACEFGFADITLHLAGRHFEERASTNGHGSWNMRIQLTESNYLSLTRQCGSLTAAHTIARLADLLYHTLSQKAAVFEAVTRKDQTITVPDSQVCDPDALVRVA